jgi:hypothetical protein
MFLNQNTSIHPVWVAVDIIWAVAALWCKPAQRIEPSGQRVLHMALIGAAFFLLFSSRAEIGPLAWRVLPESPTASYAGEPSPSPVRHSLFGRGRFWAGIGVRL